MPESKVRVKYAEGDVFAVRLEHGGYGLCVVARRHGSIILGYFFGPRYAEVPNLDSVIETLDPKNAILRAKCGAYDIFEGNWPKVGAFRPWDRANWPIPMFRSTSILRGQTAAVTYGDKNLTDPIIVDGVTTEVIEKIQQDQQFGSGAMESYLSELISMEASI